MTSRQTFGARSVRAQRRRAGLRKNEELQTWLRAVPNLPLRALVEVFLAFLHNQGPLQPQICAFEAFFATPKILHLCLSWCLRTNYAHPTLTLPARTAEHDVTIPQVPTRPAKHGLSPAPLRGAITPLNVMRELPLATLANISRQEARLAQATLDCISIATLITPRRGGSGAYPTKRSITRCGKSVALFTKP